MKTIIVYFFLFSSTTLFLGIRYKLNPRIKEIKVSGNLWEKCEIGHEFTSVTLSHKKSSKSIAAVSVGHEDYPPTFDLTNLEDGAYIAHMYACGLGGAMEIILETKEE